MTRRLLFSDDERYEDLRRLASEEKPPMGCPGPLRDGEGLGRCVDAMAGQHSPEEYLERSVPIW